MQNEHNSATTSRKHQHVDLCVNENVSFRTKTAGWERFDFLHCALPELDFSDISTQTFFLGKDISMPFMVSSMTGGYAGAEKINAQLAEICEEINIPMGVGSQRQALENSMYHNSFSVVRKFAPNIPISANIGGTHITNILDMSPIHSLIELISANALTIHLNPLQELLQPEGSLNFRGILSGISQIVKQSSVPVIVKEVGAGISNDTAKRLLDVGVACIDVAGAGGTSWAGVEILRNEDKNELQGFWDWGIPTVDCLKEISQMKRDFSFSLIASGGIASGFHIAKAIALGADLAAAAKPVMTAVVHEGQSAALELLLNWKMTLRRIMFLTGAQNIHALQRIRLREIK